MRSKAVTEHRFGNILVPDVQLNAMPDELMDYLCKGIIYRATYDAAYQGTVYCVAHPDLPTHPEGELSHNYHLAIENVVGNYRNLSLRQL